MKVSIVFYRTRNADAAHAIVGRETCEAAEIGDAVEIARELARTLAMPQLPDAVDITNAQGAILYSGMLDADGMLKDQDNDPDFSEH